MVKLVAFDIGGVLQLGENSAKRIKGHEAIGVHNYIAKKLKLDLDTWFDSIDTAYAEAIIGKISRKAALKRMSRNLNLPESKIVKLFREAYKKNFKRNNKLYEIAKTLRKNKYKTAILSDQWHLSKESLIPKKDEKLFNYSFISCDVGVRKPSKEIFKLVIARTHLKPHEIVFIDNREWNTIPAEKLGIRTILFKNNKQAVKELNKMGVNTK